MANNNNNTNGKVSASQINPKEAETKVGALDPAVVHAAEIAAHDAAAIVAYDKAIADAAKTGASAGKRRANKILGRNIPKDDSDFLAWVAKNRAPVATVAEGKPAETTTTKH